MRTDLLRSFRRNLATCLLTAVFAAPATALAEAEWISFTLDNDTFVGNDNGYTNGIFVTWWDGPEGKEKSEPGYLARLMMWSMPDDTGRYAATGSDGEAQ